MQMNKIELHKELRIESQMRDTKARNFALKNFELKASSMILARYDPDSERFYFPCVCHTDEENSRTHYIPTKHIQKIAEWITELYADPDERYKPPPPSPRVEIPCA